MTLPQPPPRVEQDHTLDDESAKRQQHSDIDDEEPSKPEGPLFPIDKKVGHNLPQKSTPVDGWYPGLLCGPPVKTPLTRSLARPPSPLGEAVIPLSRCRLGAGLKPRPPDKLPLIQRRCSGCPDFQHDDAVGGDFGGIVVSGNLSGFMFPQVARLETLAFDADGSPFDADFIFFIGAVEEGHGG